MPSINETAYPRLKSYFTEKELNEIYSPTTEEIAYASKITRSSEYRLFFLILLKTCQRLGYFIPLEKIPPAIIQHIARLLGMYNVEIDFNKYDKSRMKFYHINLVKEFLSIKSYTKEARHILVKAAAEAAKTKDSDADIINVVIEELIRQRRALINSLRLKRMIHILLGIC